MILTVIMIHSPRRIYAKDYVSFEQDGSFTVDYDRLQEDLGGEAVLLDVFHALGIRYDPTTKNYARLILEITNVTGRYDAKDDEVYIGFRPLAASLEVLEKAFHVRFIDSRVSSLWRSSNICVCYRYLATIETDII
ncbi:MAG: hypothetical protein K5911_01430 [Eubacteriales bacterium]|nr:hypothetical protein [Eubacteriales bacterium]